MQNVLISIINFNGKENTLQCLESLNKIDLSDIKLTVFVIDNASSEEIDLNKKLFKNFDLIFVKNKKNLGFSGGHNQGINYALEKNIEYVVILNNDTYVDKDFLKELINISKKNDKIGILSPKIYFAPGFEFHRNKYKNEEKGKIIWYAGGEMDWKNMIGHHRGVDDFDSGQYDKIEETEFATGCCMMIKSEVFKKIGALDEKYFLYYEDSDFNIRAKRKGFKTFYVPTSILFHKNASSTGGSGSKLQDYYISRNRMIFGMKYAPFKTKLALVKESLKILFSGRFWQRLGIIDFYMGNLGKGSYK